MRREVSSASSLYWMLFSPKGVTYSVQHKEPTAVKILKIKYTNYVFWGRWCNSISGHFLCHKTLFFLSLPKDKNKVILVDTICNCRLQLHSQQEMKKKMDLQLIVLLCYWLTLTPFAAEETEPTQCDPTCPGSRHGQKHTAPIRQTWHFVLHPGW